MPKRPDIHPYSDRIAFERLMLLIAAIAQNPGIADQRTARNAGVDPMDLLQEAMAEIAAEQGLGLEEWSAHTLRADLKTLRLYGILPGDTALRAGYYLGRKRDIKLPPPNLD